MPAFCNPDFEAMELIHARLVRKTTCANGCKCDYTVCGDRDEYLKSIRNTAMKQGIAEIGKRQGRLYVFYGKVR